MAQGVPIMYGRCDGGPWHAKDLAHHEPVFVVPLDRYSKKVVVGVVPGTKDYRFGEYRFESQRWSWVDPETCEQRNPPKPAVTKGR